VQHHIRDHYFDIFPVFDFYLASKIIEETGKATRWNSRNKTVISNVFTVSVYVRRGSVLSSINQRLHLSNKRALGLS